MHEFSDLIDVIGDGVFPGIARAPFFLGIVVQHTLILRGERRTVKLHVLVAADMEIGAAFNPVQEIYSAKLILKTLGLRKGGVSVVSCPTCGRTNIDIISLANKVEDMVKDIDADITVAVMGCVVNGPGEAREADFGIAGGRGEGLLFKKGEIIKKVPEDRLLSELMEEINKSL